MCVCAGTQCGSDADYIVNGGGEDFSRCMHGAWHRGASERDRFALGETENPKNTCLEPERVENPIPFVSSATNGAHQEVHNLQ